MNVGGAGMKRVKLSGAFDLQMGKTPSRKHLAYWRGGTEPWISIADLSNCGKYIEQTKEKGLFLHLFSLLLRGDGY